VKNSTHHSYQNEHNILSTQTRQIGVIRATPQQHLDHRTHNTLDNRPKATGNLDMTTYGTLIANDTIRFERLLPGPIERIWAYLTESDKRGLWLASGAMTLIPGGSLELHFRNAELSRDDDRAPEKYRDYENTGTVYGQILECEPPHRLRFTWTDAPGEPIQEDSEVEIVLREEGDAVRLILTHRQLHTHELLSVAAGWHTHLDILGDRLDGREPRLFWRTHTRLEAQYEQRIG
jgi:uncharacterized protein YndB with AHSA1/START domain